MTTAEEVLAWLDLPELLESEVRLVGGHNGIAIRLVTVEDARRLDLVRLPRELRPAGSRPNEIDPELAAAVEVLVEGVALTTGDEVLIASDVLTLPLFAVSEVEGALFFHWIGPW